jgi:DNA repair protein RadC
MAMSTQHDGSFVESPAKRLFRKGSAKSLTDAELFSIVAGLPNLADAEEKLRSFRGGMRYFLDPASGPRGIMTHEFSRQQAIRVLATVEFGNRLANLPREYRQKITDPEVAAGIAMPMIRALPQEHILALMLNGKSEMMDVVTVSIGGTSQAMAEMPMIFREAIRRGASGVIIAHNH